MKITKFDIRNFKGISKTSIGLTDGSPGNVSALIGLNESGKTTILEALSHFVTEDKDTATLVGTVQKKSALQDLIPKDQKAAFTGVVSVAAVVELDDSDIDDLAEEFIKRRNLVLNIDDVQRNFTVERTYEFEDSRFKTTSALWNTINFPLRTQRARKYKKYTGQTNQVAEDRLIWLEGIAFLRKRLPKIVYFPTFLFNFPDRIYLEDAESEINSYYVQVIQDVLDSQGDELSVQKHIVDRIARVKEESKGEGNFFVKLFSTDEKKQIDAVLQNASNEMSRVIFGAWNQILGRNVSGKRVQIDWSLDGENSDAPYLEVSIVDGQSKYSLSERSLGFRWFFSFLLFTEFRRNRKGDGSTLFLFDEPAANLHSKAQIRLLESFAKIGNGSTHVIYSTHSHYMINPLWLEKAYIVENRAMNYDDSADVDSFTVRKSDVKAIRYKTFVGSHPTKTTYFQPVLDALDVSFSPLVRSANALIVEGKNDYHPFVYFRRRMSELGIPEIFPANGAGSSGPLISLFRGWGVNFRIVVDDDAEGRRARKKYLDEYFLKEFEVVTLGELCAGLSGKAFEGVYSDDVKSSVRSHYGVSNPSKRQYALYFQELLANNHEVEFPDTEEVFRKISDWVDREFSG